MHKCISPHRDLDPCGEFNNLEKELIKVLDNMDGEELTDNIFRIDQTNAKLKRDNVDNEYSVNSVHYKVGRKVRNSIKRLGGTMPEKLPAPDRSLKELEKESKKLKK